MPAPAGALAVRGDVLGLRRDAERREVEPGDAAELLRRDVPAHAVVGEVGERMAERRELPVEYREDPRLGRMEHQVVEAIVAVDDHRLVAGRDRARQPFDQAVHLRDRVGRRRPVLLRPAIDLALEVVSRLAEALQPDRLVVDAVQRRDHAVHLVVDGGALARRHPRQRLLPEHAARDELHDVEREPDQPLVLAETVRARHGHAGAAERGDHAVLAVDGVRGGQELRGRRRLRAHHVAHLRRGEEERRVRLAALELGHRERAAKALDPFGEKRLQPPDVKAVSLLNCGRHNGVGAHHGSWKIRGQC